ncbi:MAG: NADH-quinone oxidoreductase subunit L [Microthrixaceae bacterium]
MWFLTHTWILPAVMTLSFLAILAVGKRLPRKGAEIGVAAVAVCFVLALLTAGSWWQHTNGSDEPAEAASGVLVAAPGAEGSGENDPAAFSDVEQGCSRVVDEEDHGEGSEAAEVGGESDGEHSLGLSGGESASAAGSTARAAAQAEEGGEGEHDATRPVVRCFTWFETGAVDATTITVGTLVDGQSVFMLVVVTLVSLLVHIYSTDYVNGDRRYTHYFAFLSLFTGSMLFFVLAQSTIQMIVGWELVGLCSFALIGHWWEEKPNSDAALKAFLTNRVGDVGLLIGVIVLYFAAGRSFSILDINILAASGGISHGILLLASCCLIAAVMSKSGQFILHTWLPDAMAGPTPVSALIHAATMVVAGIYMVARLYPVFFEGLSIAGSSVNLLAVVGAVTALFGALLAFVQKDVKKVLAYSTISQLGFMVTALGVGAWTAAMFHLFTHAMFKACLFLGAGSMSHAAHHSFNMVDDYGGLRKVMPRTFWTFLIATGALAGIFPLSGFWSKDEILAGHGTLFSTGANGTYHVMLVMLLLGAFCTAAYMTRTIWYCFYGEYRGHGTPHESGPRITIPLIILATLGAVVGLANLPEKIGPITIPDSLSVQFEKFVEPLGAYFPSISHAAFNPTLAIVSLVVAGLGAAIPYVYYFESGPALTFKKWVAPIRDLSSRSAAARWGKNVLVNKYYFDWLYTDVIAGAFKGSIARAANWVNQHVIDGIVNAAGRGTVLTGRWVYDNIDQEVVDGAVNAAGTTATESGGLLRYLQSGRIQQYAALFFAAAALLAGVFVVATG